MRIAAVALLCCGLMACATSSDPVADLEVTPVTVAPPKQVAELPAQRILPPPPPKDLWERIRRQLTWHEIETASVEEATNYYRNRPRHFALVAPRAQRYLYYLVAEVERRELPVELALLPMVESALNPFAYSPQRAAGLWQIMPGTADDLGMRRDWWYDARLDLRDSTRFALDYLEALNSEFEGDWLLTLAAYNAGKYRVRRAIKKNREQGEATDFWSLSLPRETRRYVPRLLGLASVIAAGSESGVELPEVPNRPVFTTVATGGQIEMLRLAELTDMQLSELRRFNPGQLRWATAPHGSGEVLVPLSRAERARDALQALPDEERVTWEHYRIRRGDSLILIAKRFDTQVGLLREVNNIRGNMIRAGDNLMIPNSEAWEQSLALANVGENGIKRAYKVRRGDSLYEIARRFSISIEDIVSWNKLDRSRYLQPGQALTLFVGR